MALFKKKSDNADDYTSAPLQQSSVPANTQGKPQMKATAPVKTAPKTSAPPKRKANPGSSKDHKRPPFKRGETISTPNLIGQWSPR